MHQPRCAGTEAGLDGPAQAAQSGARMNVSVLGMAGFSQGVGEESATELSRGGNHDKRPL